MIDATTQGGFRKGFQSLYDTTSDTVLSYVGQPLPAWLNDWSVIRVGGAQFEVGEQSYKHFFDGHFRAIFEFCCGTILAGFDRKQFGRGLNVNLAFLKALFYGL